MRSTIQKMPFQDNKKGNLAVIQIVSNEACCGDYKQCNIFFFNKFVILIRIAFLSSAVIREVVNVNPIILLDNEII